MRPEGKDAFLMSIFTPLTNPFKAKPSGRVHIDDPDSLDKFFDYFLRFFQGQSLLTKEIILLCIGTDRSTGDCLGPLIGTKMEESTQSLFYIYGTLDHPVHASNLEDHLTLINERFTNPYIIAVDACLGRLETVGNVNIGLGSLKPGAGVNKKLPSVGDMYITGIVNVGGFMEYFVLQNTRLNMVMKMANLITTGLNNVDKFMKDQK